MVTRIIIPQIFENMEEATIGAWLKAPGDAVRVGDALCELITEKTTFQMEAEDNGILRRVAVPEKSIVPVGYIIGLIAEADDALPNIEAENALVRSRAAASQDTQPQGEGGTQTASPSLSPTLSRANASVVGSDSAGSRLRATPAARRAARDRGIALEAVAVALPGKVLSEDDVVRFAAQM
jgi:pyruvate/2-oxoglutarate dehydrogenase complex dihydrolipoamide acyltransferase (E2) component